MHIKRQTLQDSKRGSQQNGGKHVHRELHPTLHIASYVQASFQQCAQIGLGVEGCFLIDCVRKIDLPWEAVCAQKKVNAEVFVRCPVYLKIELWVS